MEWKMHAQTNIDMHSRQQRSDSDPHSRVACCLVPRAKPPDSTSHKLAIRIYRVHPPEVLCIALQECSAARDVCVALERCDEIHGGTVAAGVDLVSARTTHGEKHEVGICLDRDGAIWRYRRDHCGVELPPGDPVRAPRIVLHAIRPCVHFCDHRVRARAKVEMVRVPQLISDIKRCVGVDEIVVQSAREKAVAVMMARFS